MHNYKNSSFTWLLEYGTSEPCCNSNHVGTSSVSIGVELCQFIISFQFSKITAMWVFPKCSSCMGCRKMQAAKPRPIPPHLHSCFNLEMSDGSGPSELARKVLMFGLKHENRTGFFSTWLINAVFLSPSYHLLVSCKSPFWHPALDWILVSD